MIADEVLALRAQAGDELALEALLTRYERHARVVASAYFLPNGDENDLRQEALIGLVKGVRTFRIERHVGSFGAYLDMCMRRHVLTAVKVANRAKHRVLNEAVLFSVPLRPRAGGEDFAGTVGDSVADGRRNTHLELVDRDDFRALVDFLASELSELESASLIGLINGHSYREIDAALIAAGDGDRPGRAAYNESKVVDNALSRARRKARQFIEERDAA